MTDKIQKFIKKLDPKKKEIIISKIEKIIQDPFSQKDLKKIKGIKNNYRIRIGNIRIIFEIDAKKNIEIIDVDYRGNIY